ncbi:TrmB family transcriptional regulator [Dictyobacter aurantiacus]|uniref:Transcription regulator TrmB N-terminal domain-containing protein n=1 Tax=Dictyobacter aurantiacus TaxID=1936993 RepID=A0A401ZK57_9CHLR|nr:TrmB family transcriptional regulator [Dictyobacter aurantiacus]GCE07210.1 hypothetical protein KDAU_45390 [Dictyobacter aurantiacus]
MTTVDLLQQLGLNKYEAEAYYTLLTRGALTGYEVGKYSQVPGSRSYEVMERLLEKGLALVQPGDPPRYTAQDPQAVFARFRASMESTLETLTMTLTALARSGSLGEFWVVRGQRHILARAVELVSQARTSLDLIIPAHPELVRAIEQARARGCHVFHAPTDEQDENVVLLLRDGREALVGTLIPAESCQAVLSSNQALLETLHGYFHYRRSPDWLPSEAPATQQQDVAWLDWEARKQRQLRGGGRNRVA